MSRYFAVPVFALTAIVAACGRSDRPQTTSSTAGANPPVKAFINLVRNRYRQFFRHTYIIRTAAWTFNLKRPSATHATCASNLPR